MLIAVLHNSQEVEASQCLHMGECINKVWFMHKVEEYSAFERKGLHDEPGACYVKWSTPVVERQMLYDSTNIGYLKYPNS